MSRSSSHTQSRRGKASSGRKPGLSYKSAGVNIDEGNAFVDFILKRVHSTYSDRVIPHDDGYAGLFSMVHAPARFRKNYKRPVLVACNDGVGTKLNLAFMTKKHDTVGIDAVAMCVNDLICMGGEPLFFLDYIGCSRLERQVSRQLIDGVINGCKEANCALLGGETAELPGLYRKGEYDLVGCAVGVVEEGHEIRGKDIAVGDVIIGLPSSGPHSNGYSLLRRALFTAAGYTHRKRLPSLGGKTLGEVLLAPTRIYVRSILALLAASGRRKVVTGLAHITGGGLIENIPRILPRGCQARLFASHWPRQPIFSEIQRAGNIATAEMYRVFNMGIGFVVIVRPETAKAALSQLRKTGETPYVIGEVVRGKNITTIE